MNMTEIKSQIVKDLNLETLPTLMFNRVFEDEDRKISTPWVASWLETVDANSVPVRVRVSIHDDVWLPLKSNPTDNCLYLKDNGLTQKDGKLPYHAFIVCKSKHTEGAF